MASIPEVKEALVALLGETLPSDVVVGYSYKEGKGRKVVIGDVTTTYNTARMRADSSLLRYDLMYAVTIECYSGQYLRAPQTAEGNAYGLLDLVLTPLVRGDATGRTRLAERLPSVIEVVPSTDTRVMSWEDAEDNEVVLALTINIRTRRE